MHKTKTNLTVIDGETLMDMKLPPTKFCVETLLPQGILILGGAPKIGKSWMVLDLCVRIAKGEAIWNLSTQKGTTLYLCLEDPLNRIQQRLCMLTDEVPENAYFATAAGTLEDGLCEQIRNFVLEHTDTVLVAIDTFQIVRASTTDTSYANDYDDVRQMKQFADELEISILLVHHLRKGSYNRKYDDFVCVNELGELIRPSYVTQHFSDLLKKYGLRHIRFHDLRHTFASILIGQDVPLINVSNFLGHSDLSTTANIYAHLDKASKQASADIMTDILNMGKS